MSPRAAVLLSQHRYILARPRSPGASHYAADDCLSKQGSQLAQTGLATLIAAAA